MCAYLYPPQRDRTCVKKKAKPFKITKADFEAAIERGKVMEATVPHARSASFDRDSQKIIVELTNNTVPGTQY